MQCLFHLILIVCFSYQRAAALKCLLESCATFTIDISPLQRATSQNLKHNSLYHSNKLSFVLKLCKRSKLFSTKVGPLSCHFFCKYNYSSRAFAVFRSLIFGLLNHSQYYLIFKISDAMKNFILQEHRSMSAWCFSELAGNSFLE